MKGKIILFALVALFGALAASLTPGAGCSAGTGYAAVCDVSAFDNCGDATSFITVSFAIVGLAIGLAYMYGKAREDAAAVTWAKVEAQNLLLTVLIFAGLLLFFTGSCHLSESFADGDPFAVSQRYLNTLLEKNGVVVIRTLTADSLTNQMTATSALFIGMTPFGGSGVSNHAWYKALSAQKEFVIDLYLPIVASLTAQKYLLQAIQWFGASLLLPFAFVLRIIPPTRDFGNILIALFFGLYIVAPAMYVMSTQAFSGIVSHPDQITGANTFYTYGLDGKSSGAGTDAVFYKIGSTIPQAVFLPNLVLIVVVASATALSKALKAISV